MDRILTHLAGITFMTLFAAGGVSFLRLLVQANASEDWPTVPGIIQHSEVVREHSKKRGFTHSGKVVYQYRVGADVYTSSRVSFGGDHSPGAGPARRFVERYPVGKNVRVYYDPEAPDEAVLEPGPSWWNWVVPAALLLISPVCPLVWLVRRVWSRLSA